MRGYLDREDLTRRVVSHGWFMTGDIGSFHATTDVCTFGFEDPLYGEDIGIAVVLEKRDPETIAELRSWVETRIARHKVPQRWYLLEAISRTSRGKINREEVARTCSVLKPMDTRA